MTFSLASLSMTLSLMNNNRPSIVLRLYEFIRYNEGNYQIDLPEIKKGAAAFEALPSR
jgi:hypothetical protein